MSLILKLFTGRLYAALIIYCALNQIVIFSVWFFGISLWVPTSTVKFCGSFMALLNQLRSITEL